MKVPESKPVETDDMAEAERVWAAGGTVTLMGKAAEQWNEDLRRIKENFKEAQQELHLQVEIAKWRGTVFWLVVLIIFLLLGLWSQCAPKGPDIEGYEEQRDYGPPY